MINIKKCLGIFSSHPISDWDQNILDCESLLNKAKVFQKRLFCLSNCILFHELYIPYLCLINDKQSIIFLKDGIDFFWNKLNDTKHISCESEKEKLLSIFPPSIEERTNINDIVLQKKYDSTEAMLAIEVGVIFFYSYDFYRTGENQNLHWVINATLGATEYLAQLTQENNNKILLCKQFERNIKLIHLIVNDISSKQINQQDFRFLFTKEISIFSHPVPKCN